MIEQFSSMEHDRFHVSYLSDKIPEAVFHGQAVKTVAYLRVSTAQQDVRSQRLAILEYARKDDFRIDDFIEATASGQASEKRRRLDEMMNVLQRGDHLSPHRPLLFEAPERPGVSPSGVLSDRTGRQSSGGASGDEGSGRGRLERVFMMESLSALTSDYASLSVSGSRRSLTRQFREA